MASGAAEPNIEQIRKTATVARREVKRLATQTRRSIRALAQLDALLAEHGIGLEIHDHSPKEDTGHE